MTQQHFHGPVAKVAAGSIECNYWLDTAPPDDPDMSTQCPQCTRLTWRYSRHCVHCQLDLVRWRARSRWAALAELLLRRLRRHKESA